MSKNLTANTIVLMVIVLIVGLGIGYFVFTSQPQPEPEQLKLAFIMSGPRGDFGMNYEVNRGAEKVKSLYPDAEVVVVENAFGADAPIIMKAYADRDFDIIFCCSFGFGDYVVDLAPQYPDITWMWLGAPITYGGMTPETHPNVGIFTDLPHEPHFVMGIIAGKMTKTNKIGFTLGHPISSLIRSVNAMARGIALVNPDATLHVNYVGAWYDPALEKEAAEALLEQGVDVLADFTNSPSPGVAVQDRYTETGDELYYLGHHSDTRLFCPDVFLTGGLHNYEVIFADIIERYIDGTWADYQGPETPYKRDWYWGFPAIKLATFSGKVPTDVQDLANQYVQDITDETYLIFPDFTYDEQQSMRYYEDNVVAPPL
jgi:basic membrane lipoprotein Med (substrate-binding protein (PBP1-ABC) superfamily)